MAIIEKIFLHSNNAPNSIAIINKNEKITMKNSAKIFLLPLLN